jgi:hypothetical protein
MPLILAIEPDRRQAARISALGRGTLDAELLVADSTERGIAALQGRTPDLILTSLLLSPKDEAGLRELDNGGVPVPTLMIPMLASSSQSKGGRGGLRARLPWSKPAAPVANDGCDPQVFAGQIEEYLARVHEAHEVEEIRGAYRIRDGHDRGEIPELRTTLEVHDAVPPPEAVTAFDDSAIVAFSPDVQPLEASALHETASVPDVLASPEIVALPDLVAVPEAAAVPEIVAVPEVELVLEIAAASEVVMAPEVVPDSEAIAAPEVHSASERLAMPADQTAPEFLAAQPVDEAPVVNAPTIQETEARADAFAVDEATADTTENPETKIDGWEETLLAEGDDETIELSNEAVDLDAFVDELKATYADLFPQNAAAKNERKHAAPAAPEGDTVRERPAKTLVTVAHELPLRVSWPSLEGMAAEEAPPLGMAEVVAEFVAALEEAGSEPEEAGQDDPDELWMPLSAPAGAFWPRLESACSRTRPLQDEWGFFDPDQCGFSALVAKLDQMSK